MQTKLAISRPGDEYEREADRLSERVMRMPEPRIQRACAGGGKCLACQDEEPGKQAERLQTRRLGSSDLNQSAAPDIVHDVLHTPGQSLDTATRAFMETRFGYDFSQVRVHSGAKAAESAKAVDALAYTVGQNIVFGAGQYAPHMAAGRRLLAHELVHTMQQADRARFQTPLTPSSQNGFEQEAGLSAQTSVPTREDDQPGLTHSGQPTLQRQPLAPVPLLIGHMVKQWLDPANQQFKDDVFASLDEAPQHAGEVLVGEVWEAIREHWLAFLSVTAGLLTAEFLIGVLTANPEPFISKFLASLLQYLTVVILGFFAAVEFAGVMDQCHKWLDLARQANGDPLVITEASRAFLRMIRHLIFAILAVGGVRARVSGAPRGGPVESGLVKQTVASPEGKGGELINLADYRPGVRPQASGPQTTYVGPRGEAFKLDPFEVPAPEPLPQTSPVPAPAVEPAPLVFPVSGPAKTPSPAGSAGPGIQPLPVVAVGAAAASRRGFQCPPQTITMSQPSCGNPYGAVATLDYTEKAIGWWWKEEVTEVTPTPPIQSCASGPISQTTIPGVMPTGSVADEILNYNGPPASRAPCVHLTDQIAFIGPTEADVERCKYRNRQAIRVTVSKPTSPKADKVITTCGEAKAECDWK